VNELLNTLLSSPLFYFVIIVLILTTVFRRQIGDLIQRLTKAEASLDAGGVKGKIEASSTLLSQPNAAPAGHSVSMKGVELDGASEIDEIRGNVKMENVSLDEGSKIGKIRSE